MCSMVFMEIYMQSIDPSRNRFRFYNMVLQKDLFGNHYFIRHWGRIGSKGKTKSCFYKDESKVYKDVAKIIHTRLLHGYINID